MMLKKRFFVKYLLTLVLVTGSVLFTVHPVQADEAESVSQVDNFSFSKDMSITWQSPVYGSTKLIAWQFVCYESGVHATLTFNKKRNTFTVKRSDGVDFTVSLEEILYPESMDVNSELRWKKPNKCQVATGIAGIAHTTLWSAAVGSAGGPAGTAAGIAVGVGYGTFWWLVGSQC